MEKKIDKKNEQSRLKAFLTGDRLKGLLPLIGFVVIIVVMNILTDGKINGEFVRDPGLGEQDLIAKMV